jgi:hypothetical protein
VRAFEDPRLQLSGWFCQGGSEFIQQRTLVCALDRLTLLAAGSEPKVGVLFAQAERNRSFCGQRDPILAATPKYHLQWKALATDPSRAASDGDHAPASRATSHSMRLPGITIDRRRKSSDHIPIRISEAQAMAAGLGNASGERKR